MNKLVVVLGAALALAMSPTPGLAQIDIVADSVSLDANEVAAGASIGVSFLGHLEGSGTIQGGFSVGFYLSPDSNITTDDLVLFQYTELADSQGDPPFGLSNPIQVPVPANTDRGDYFLGMIVDDLEQVAETDESNNTESDNVEVTTVVTGPNLIAVSCSVTPTTVRPGEDVDFTWRGRNNGSAANAVFQWGIYLSTDPDIDRATDTFLKGGTVVTGWAADFDTGDVVEALIIDSAIADGSYFVGILLDTMNAVDESSEDDNQCVKALVVTSAPGITRWLIPAAASAPGVGSSNWKTQLQIVNPDDIDRIANVFYVAKGASWPGSLLQGPIDVLALKAALLDDPLLSQNPTTGLMYVVVDAPGPLVTSRTYNLGSGGATFGQGIPAIALDTATAPSRLIIPMAHSIPGRFRTNLGLVQTSAGSYEVEVKVHSTDGFVLATKRYTRTGAFDQINNLFGDMGIANPGAEGAWISVRLISGQPLFWTCYASVVDDLTGDPTYVAPIEP